MGGSAYRLSQDRGEGITKGKLVAKTVGLSRDT